VANYSFSVDGLIDTTVNVTSENNTYPTTFMIPGIPLGAMVNVSVTARSVDNEVLMLDGDSLFFIGVPASRSDACGVSDIPPAVDSSLPFNIGVTNFTGLSCLLLDSNTTMTINVCSSSLIFRIIGLQGENMTESYINANNTNLTSNYAYTFPGYTTGGYQPANVTLTNRLGAFTCNASVDQFIRTKFIF
jgi:hypothetical protein